MSVMLSALIYVSLLDKTRLELCEDLRDDVVRILAERDSGLPLPQAMLLEIELGRRAGKSNEDIAIDLKFLERKWTEPGEPSVVANDSLTTCLGKGVFWS